MTSKSGSTYKLNGASKVSSRSPFTDVIANKGGFINPCLCFEKKKYTRKLTDLMTNSTRSTKQTFL